jgi:hypothetical protein
VVDWTSLVPGDSVVLTGADGQPTSGWIDVLTPDREILWMFGEGVGCRLFYRGDGCTVCAFRPHRRASKMALVLPAEWRQLSGAVSGNGIRMKRWNGTGVVPDSLGRQLSPWDALTGSTGGTNGY